MPNFPPNLCVVLVEPSLPENIGAVARAMNNFGIPNLRLVNPCDLQNPAAQRTAAHSQSILQNALRFQSLQNAVSQSHFVIGATARPRNRFASPVPLPSLPAKLPSTPQNIALVFGRESSGLTNRELSCCHLLLTIPTNTQNPSLNLAQAVALTLYELSRNNPPNPKNQHQANQKLATSQDLENLKTHLFAVLQQIRFLKNPKQRQTLWQRFSDLAARAQMQTADLRLIRGFLRKTQQTIHRQNR